jgi:hypothetical protein
MEGIPEWVTVFRSATAAPILEFLRQNPGFDGNIMFEDPSGPDECAIQLLFYHCDFVEAVSVLRELVARGLWMDPKYPLRRPLDLAYSSGYVSCCLFLLDMGVKPSWESVFEFAHRNNHNSLHWLLWDALPPVSAVERAQQEMRERAYLKEDSKQSNDILAMYVRRFKNRTTTLSATMWVMRAVPGDFWRDLADLVVGSIMRDMPVQEFVRPSKKKRTKK